MPRLVVKEIYTNETNNYIISDSGYYEPYTTSFKKLFNLFQREYGRCVSKVYRETKNHDGIPMGWVFEKKVKYTDCNDIYIQNVWIEFAIEYPNGKYIPCYIDRAKFRYL